MGGYHRMTDEQRIALIKQYAPILWVHESDAFLPEDCKIMEDIAKIGTSEADMRAFELDELGNLDNSGKYYMDIPEVNFRDFGVKSEYAGPGLGPQRLSTHLRKAFGNSPVLDAVDRESRPQYHARVSKIRVTYRDDEPFSRHYAIRDPGVFGDYNVVQYYFFYVFNDSWNKHIGDWDSTFELFLKDDNSRAYAILHMHHLAWMVRFSGQPPGALTDWIADWRDVEGEGRMGRLYHYGGHPFIFVACGAHGGYPTPGFSVHGIKPLVAKVIAQTDVRQIGKLCIVPDYPPVTEDAILGILNDADVDTNGTTFLPWETPIHLDRQPWLRFKGLWGTESEYSGWSGPTGPACKSCWRMDQRRFKRAFANACEGEYSGGWILKILRNWHGWR